MVLLGTTDPLAVAIAVAAGLRRRPQEDVVRAIRLRLKKNCGINFDQQDVAEAVQTLLLNGHREAHKPKALKK